MSDHPIYKLKKARHVDDIDLDEILTPKFLISSAVRDEFDYLTEAKKYSTIATLCRPELLL